MHIAILGTGALGGAVARGLAGKGHDLILGVRDPQAETARKLASDTGAAIAAAADAAQASELVILALPWAATEEVLPTLGPLDGKIVIDATNPLGRTPQGLGLTIGFTNSGGEKVQGWLPGARVVKTLNQVGAEVVADAARLPHRPAMLMAGDDAAAKLAVAEILEDLGFDPLDAGRLVQARLLEPFGMVWINQAMLRGKGRSWAFAAVEAQAPPAA
ncbi:NADPH-dependent F420 reductase [Roseicyclus marinus]|uniref:NADPH-dependent F420 reductase n=1 Tax=Roseicyclus marinus TaxID=2161673 RepID=UPI00240FD9B1|nr:NAD(P)-binding domain-containing protein [Roseicyclus marinus]MDG3039769.1 NAD(P)-binding domain-containing protein [Roseicyclus marinus]